MKAFNEFITDHNLQDRIYRPSLLLPLNHPTHTAEALVVLYDADEPKYIITAESVEEAVAIATDADKETSFSIGKCRRSIAVGKKISSVHYNYLMGNEIKRLL